MIEPVRAAVSFAALLLVACGEERQGPREPDAGTVALGRAVYLEHCAACHGGKGEGAANGQSPDVAGELPPPPHDSTGHTWKHADGMLYRIVSGGWRDPFNETERLTMPAFRGVLAAAEIEAVVIYLKTLWTPEQREFQWRESQDDPFPRGAAAGIPEGEDSI